MSAGHRYHERRIEVNVCLRKIMSTVFRFSEQVSLKETKHRNRDSEVSIRRQRSVTFSVVRVSRRLERRDVPRRFYRPAGRRADVDCKRVTMSTVG